MMVDQVASHYIRGIENVFHDFHLWRGHPDAVYRLSDVRLSITIIVEIMIATALDLSEPRSLSVAQKGHIRDPRWISAA